MSPDAPRTEQRCLALAAGMLLDVEDPVRCIRIAAEAGFDALGLRLLRAKPSLTMLRRIQRELDRSGMILLDLETVRSTTEQPLDPDHHVVMTALELAPRHLTTVADHADHARLVDELGGLCEVLNPAGVRPALEFLPFSGVRTLHEATAIVQGVGHGRAAVLVDTLHLQRSAASLVDLRRVDPRLVPYVQFCDATAEPPDRSDRGLYREAVGARLLPGHGAIPLVAMLDALPPGVPLSVEVLSDELMSSHGPLERAVACREATEAILELAREAGTGR